MAAKTSYYLPQVDSELCVMRELDANICRGVHMDEEKACLERILKAALSAETPVGEMIHESKSIQDDVLRMQLQDAIGKVMMHLTQVVLPIAKRYPDLDPDADVKLVKIRDGLQSKGYLTVTLREILASLEPQHRDLVWTIGGVSEYDDEFDVVGPNESQFAELLKSQTPISTQDLAELTSPDTQIIWAEIVGHDSGTKERVLRIRAVDSSWLDICPLTTEEATGC